MLVLDWGAGINPDIRATDAIDRSSGDNLQRKIAREVKDFNLTKDEAKKLKNKIKNVRYIWGINANETPLSYPSNSFDRVVSSGGINAWGNIFAYREVFRILKPEGKIEVNHVDPVGHEIIKKRLRIVGFGNFKTKTSANPRTIRDILFFRHFKPWQTTHLKSGSIMGTKPHIRRR